MVEKIITPTSIIFYYFKLEVSVKKLREFQEFNCYFEVNVLKNCLLRKLLAFAWLVK